MGSDNRTGSVIAASVILFSLAAVAVALRFFARYKRKVGFKTDDWCALVGLVGLLGMLIEGILWAAIGGAGKHWRDLTGSERILFFKIFFSTQVTFVPLTPFIKLSVIFLYRRIFSVRPFRIATTVLIVLTCVYFFITLFLVVFYQSTRKAWQMPVPGAPVAPMNRMLAWQGVNTGIDFLILLLPIPMCWRLQRPWQDRLALLGVFMVGTFVCAASLYRIFPLLRIDHQDISYSIYDAAVWTMAEPSIGLVCSCLPVIRGLFPSFHKKTSRKSTSSPASARKPHSTGNMTAVSNNSSRFGGSDGKDNVKNNVKIHDGQDSSEMLRIEVSLSDSSWDELLVTKNGKSVVTQVNPVRENGDRVDEADLV